MGYRSSVGLAITGQILPTIIEDEAELTDLLKQLLSEADDHIRSEDGNHLFVWEDTKWNDSYPEVAALHKRLRDVNSESFLFIRIGEDDLDIERIGEWYDNDFELGCLRRLSYHDIKI